MSCLALCLAMLDSNEDRVAFEALYRKYEHFVWNEVQKIVKRKEDIEDISQEVFFYIADNFEKVQERDHRQIMRYIGLCAKGRALNFLRDTKNDWIETDEDMVEKAVDALDLEKVVLSWENIERMHQVIAELPDHYRLPVEARMMDMSPADIAKMLNLPRGTVYKQIERGCAIIRERMAKSDGQ